MQNINGPFPQEALNPLCLETFEHLCSRLPSALAGRLTCSRHVRRHGSHSDLLLFNIWDKGQLPIFDPKYFCYCLGFHQNARSRGQRDAYLHLYINKSRIYHCQSEVIGYFQKHLPRCCPPPFVYEDRPEVVQLYSEFDLPTVNKIPGFLLSLYLKLLPMVHPVVMGLIDSMPERMGGSGADPAAHVSIHPRTPRLPKADLDQYSRSIPPARRKQVLDQCGYRCALCGADLRKVPAHIDHIIPFRKGGTRHLENLQALCAACNLSKGGQ